MLMTILFGLGTVRAIQEVDKRYAWYHNLEITLRSYKTWFIMECIQWFMVIFVSVLYYMTTILGDKMYEPVNYFGTLGNAMSYTSAVFAVALMIYAVLKMFEPNYRIEEIHAMYEESNWEEEQQDIMEA